jgi:mRNA-degrading endonuclease toxin of MazEF toxin-antitoxin module
MVRIRFTAGDRTKRRPAVILTNDKYHNSRADAVVVALSGRLADTYYGDYELLDWRMAGLPQPTKAKGIIETIDRITIEQTFGTLSKQDFANLKECLRNMLGLDIPGRMC